MMHINYNKTLFIMIIISLISFETVFASGEINNNIVNINNNLSMPNVLATDFEYNKIDIATTTDCGIISEDLNTWLTGLLNLLRIGALVLTLIFGMLDFTKATLSSDKDALKKAQGNFSKRLMAVVLLFIVPAIISFILNISGIPIFSNDPFCGIE